DDGGGPHAVADDVSDGGDRGTGPVEALVDRLLQPGRRSESAVALGEVHPGEAEVELADEELDGIGGGGVELAEQLVAQGQDVVLVDAGGGGGGGAHRRPPYLTRGSSDRGPRVSWPSPAPPGRGAPPLPPPPRRAPRRRGA